MTGRDEPGMLKSNPLPPGDDDFWDDWPEVEPAPPSSPYGGGDHRQEVMADIAMRCAGLRYERGQRWWIASLIASAALAAWGVASCFT